MVLEGQTVEAVELWAVTAPRGMQKRSSELSEISTDAANVAES